MTINFIEFLIYQIRSQYNHSAFAALLKIKKKKHRIFLKTFYLNKKKTTTQITSSLIMSFAFQHVPQ